MWVTAFFKFISKLLNLNISLIFITFPIRGNQKVVSSSKSLQKKIVDSSLFVALGSISKLSHDVALFSSIPSPVCSTSAHSLFYLVFLPKIHIFCQFQSQPQSQIEFVLYQSCVILPLILPPTNSPKKLTYSLYKMTNSWMLKDENLLKLNHQHCFT